MKTCTLCNQVKQDTDFGYRSRNPDKRYARCKICMRPYYRKRHQARLSSGWKQKPRTPEQKARYDNRNRQFYQNNPERQASKSFVHEAVKRGERMILDEFASLRIKGDVLFKPLYCPICGKLTPTHSLHGHHYQGYKHPKIVIFMCQSCHAAITALERVAVSKGLPKITAVGNYIRQQRESVTFSSKPPQIPSSPAYNPSTTQTKETTV